MQPSAVEADSAVVATPEAEDRVQCAAAYRLASRFGWDTGSIYNHITVRSGEDAASGAPHFLINPFGLDCKCSSPLRLFFRGSAASRRCCAQSPR